MKKYLLPEKGTFYKANLHTHSTVSDGCYTPEEIKKIYKENGYSVISYTDHNTLVSHDYLNDENFLTMPGVEIDINDENKDITGKTCHLCFVALSPEINSHPLWEEGMTVDKSTASLKMSYTPECISDIMKTGKEKGFFTTYNHPQASLEEYSEYINYDNMCGMEIYNSCSVNFGILEYNAVIYDEMLKAGKKLFAIATDDTHHPEDVCTGYVMIKASGFEYDKIASALTKGDFYSSTGPSIYSLWYDTETKCVNIETSDVKQIIFTTAVYRRGRFTAERENRKYINRASFQLLGDEKYIRVTVIDENFKIADTNAYFLTDFINL